MKKIINSLKRKLFRTCNSEINYNTMKAMIEKNPNIIIIDVRTKDEYRDKHIKGAINIPLQDIDSKIEKSVRNKNEIIILYCEYGGRSKKAMYKLEKLGYANVYNLSKGIASVDI